MYPENGCFYCTVWGEKWFPKLGPNSDLYFRQSLILQVASIVFRCSFQSRVAWPLGAVHLALDSDHHSFSGPFLIRYKLKKNSDKCLHSFPTCYLVEGALAAVNSSCSGVTGMPTAPVAPVLCFNVWTSFILYHHHHFNKRFWLTLRKMKTELGLATYGRNYDVLLTEWEVFNFKWLCYPPQRSYFFWVVHSCT